MARRCVTRHALTALPLAAALLAMSPAGPGMASPGQPGAGSCREYEVPVTLAGLLGPYQIAGVLCLPSGGAPSTVQVLIPGATYDHTYWDFPVPGYSYARYAQAHGQATFAMDRFNTGDSSRLPSALVTVEVDSNVVHQVIAALVNGEVGGVSFSKVVTMGHSLGSIIAADEAATYHDENGVILTGVSHSVNPVALVAVAAGQVLVPAPLASPRLAGQPLGDLSTPPGARARWFYAPGDADPAVIAADQATESVITAGELPTLFGPIALPETAGINVPVLQVVGSRDDLFYCGLAMCADAARLRNSEGTSFSGAPSYTSYVLPGSGHDLNLAINRTQFFGVASQWVSARIGG